jgi:hypothetical protein
MYFLTPGVIEALRKCSTYPEFAGISLQEGSIKNLLVEVLDPKDTKEVRDSLDATGKVLDAIENYLNLFNLGPELDDLDNYIGKLRAALEKAEDYLTNVEFEPGALSGWFGKQVTLPNIIHGSVKLSTRANSFARGILMIMQKIQKNLIPKNANRDDTLAAALEADGKNSQKIKDGLEKMILKGFESGDNWADKISRGIGSVFRTFGAGTAAGDIVSTAIGDFDFKGVSKRMADALINVKIDNFMGQIPEPPSEKLDSDLQEPLKDAAERAEQDEEQEGETPETGEVPIADEKEAAVEQKQAESEIKNAVKGEVDKSQSPKDAVFGALDAWNSELSATSQKSLTSKNRIGALKDAISAALDDSAKAIESEVAAAIQAWRGDHEETLIKSKRFAKKNFDSLQQLIPRLASIMLKKTTESRSGLNKKHVKSFVYSYLNKHFQNRLDEQKMSRWQLLAGLK